MHLLPKELIPWIVAFAPLFSKPVWKSALVMLVGAIVAPGKRTVSAILRAMGLEHESHFQNYHRVLSRAVWSSSQASRILLQQLVTVFAPTGVLVMGIDDTIERRWGKCIVARGIYRDPARSSDSHFVKTSRLRWLSLMLLVPCLGQNGFGH
jgi:DDE superfamily endonuclease